MALPIAANILNCYQIETLRGSEHHMPGAGRVARREQSAAPRHAPRQGARQATTARRNEAHVCIAHIIVTDLHIVALSLFLAGLSWLVESRIYGLLHK